MRKGGRQRRGVCHGSSALYIVALAFFFAVATWFTLDGLRVQLRRPLHGGLKHTAAPAAAGNGSAPRALEAWTQRSQPFLNVFLVWTTPRDTWTALQDRVLGSVAAKIPSARVRVLSNTLPPSTFAALAAEGFDVGVQTFDLPSLLRGLPGERWLAAALAEAGPYLATHVSDLLRIVLLYRYGGLYLDTDALWLRDVAGLPEAFIGSIDFLRLEPTCAWCLEKRWYLANGIMSFPQGHSFLLLLLRAIDDQPYRAEERTAIGPRFLTSAYLSAPPAVVRSVSVLEEVLMYPIAGPDVPLHFEASQDAAAVVRRLQEGSYSAHLFAHTFAHQVIHPQSVFGQLLAAEWPAARGGLCGCTLVDPLSPLCVPHSVIVPYALPAYAWYWPAARLCLRLHAPALAWARSVTVTVSARHGVLRTWAAPPARSQTLTLYPPHWTSGDLQSLEYRPVGDHCNVLVTVLLHSANATFAGRTPHALSRSFSVDVVVSAPCLDSGQLPMVPSDLRTRFPMTWAGDVGPLLPARTASELAAERSASKFTRCLRLGSASLLQQAAAANSSGAARRLRVGLIVSATGTYLSWLDGLLASAEAYFLRSAEVHYFVLTDRESLDFEPRERIHVLLQPLLGWPYDSMFRHQLYLKFRQHFVGMDYLVVLDADVTFVSEVGEEVLGGTMGAQQAYFFGQAPEAAPFEQDEYSTSFVPKGQGACYYAGGLFGGSYAGFTRILLRTTMLMEWDLAYLGHTASHDDESYLNKVFLSEPPDVSLGGNYIYPEPPADRMWGMHDVSWSGAFVPRIHNLGARKWLGGAAATDRAYATPFTSEAALQMLSASAAAPLPQLLTVCVCAALPPGEEDKRDFFLALVDSVVKWYSRDARIAVVDTDPQGAVSAQVVEGWVAKYHLSGADFVSAPGSSSSGASPLGGGCSPAALRRLLHHVHTSAMLLVDVPAVLTWQSYLPFLHAQLVHLNDAAAAPASSLGVVVSCLQQPQGATGSDGSGDATLDFTPLCSLPSAQSLELERVSLPAAAVLTPMRKLVCWEVEGVVGYSVLVMPAALARNLTALDFPQRCAGIDCWLEDGLRVLQEGGGERGTRVWGCLRELQPIMMERK